MPSMEVSQEVVRMNDKQQLCKMFDSMPMESYEDYVLWICMNFIDNPKHPADIMHSDTFMTISQYADWVESYSTAKHVLETLVLPLGETGRA